MPILVHNQDGTFNLQGLTLDELSVIYHVVNNAAFAEALPKQFKRAADNLWEVIGSGECPAYRGGDVHVQFAEAMGKA